MYLSRLILNPLSRRVQKEIANPYEMHRTIMRAFPESVDEDSERVLFRVDQHPRQGTLCLLVQSLGQPDWSWIPGEKGHRYLEQGVADNPAVKAFDPDFEKGQTLVFRLRGNPTVKRNGKRVGLYRYEEQEKWLKRKAEAGGFRVLQARASEEGLTKGKLHRDEETHQLKLLAVRFDGVLAVTDPELFSRTLARGIGSAKGLGFGLLSLARPT